MRNNFATFSKSENIAETNNLIVVTYDDDIDISLKVIWEHFSGSVLNMKEDDFLYEKKLMVTDELEVTKLHCKESLIKSGCRGQRHNWGAIVKVAKKHAKELKAFRNTL